MSNAERSSSAWALVKIPAIITLCVTILRLSGELMGWNQRFFGSAPGGGGAIVGIAWLVVIFGFLFGRRLHATAGGPGAGRVIVMTLIAIAFIAGVIFGLAKAGLVAFPQPGDKPQEPAGLGYFFAVLGIGAIIALAAWPRLGVTLLLYAILARIPVVIVTFVAVYADWQTHYSSLPENVPPQEGMDRILQLCMPQLTFWIAFTIIVGMLFGGIGAATAGKRRW